MPLSLCCSLPHFFSFAIPIRPSWPSCSFLFLVCFSSLIITLHHPHCSFSPEFSSAACMFSFSSIPFALAFSRGLSSDFLINPHHHILFLGTSARTSSCLVLASYSNFFKPSSIFSMRCKPSLVACFLASAITCSTTRCTSSLVACDLPTQSVIKLTCSHIEAYILSSSRASSLSAFSSSSTSVFSPRVCSNFTELALRFFSSLHPSCPCVFLHLASCS